MAALARVHRGAGRAGRRGDRRRLGHHDRLPGDLRGGFRVLPPAVPGRSAFWHVPDDLRVSVDAQDLAEILGNLAENAAKWALRAVRIAGESQGDEILVSVDDDGPGIPEEKIETVLARGGRLDETQSGSGLGLAIVGDLLDAYGGSLALRRSSLGGLRAEIRLPLHGA